MSSLTPASRSNEATSEAYYEGAINGLFTLIPSTAAVALAMKTSPKFLRVTNFQSRTALAIMPAMFVAALTSELKLSQKMHDIAHETRHAQETVQWAERQNKQTLPANASALEEQQQLTRLYQQSVKESGVSIVPGDQLSLPQKAANFTADNPIKVLAALAVPGVAWIFYGNTGKEHLSLSVKLLHTRVFGQFATLSILLSLMGFKNYMDNHGRFITQADADARVEEMKQVRANLLGRLAAEKEHREALQREIAEAHKADIKDHEQQQEQQHSDETAKPLTH